MRKKAHHSTVLLIDNQGLSHYTSYLACGLSRYRQIILCGFSRDDYENTGAFKLKRIKFYDIGEKLPKASPLISLIVLRPLFLLFIMFRILTKTKFDIVHFNGHLPLFFLFLPLLKLKAKQICWTLHDVKLRPSSKGTRGKLELLYIRIMTQPSILSKYVDVIIVHGSLLKKQLTSKGVNQNKVYVIPHFDYRYLLDYGNITKSNDRILTKDYILFFGRIVPYKGIDTLINSARIVRKQIGNKFTILIAGKGHPSYFKDILTKEEYEYIHIDVRGEFIPNSEIPDLFRNAKFLVLPYSDASQSGVLSLAYTFSKPVIVSNVGSMPEYVDHSETGFIFESGNVTQLAKYIIELLENNGKCNEMGRKAYQKMIQEMSLERCCEKINDIYIRNQ